MLDVQQDSGTSQASAWAGSPRAASAQGRDEKLDGERVIPVVKEELQIGKRRRDRGGVRIYSHMDEEPVQENVRLRDEHAKVERRPADRAATAADLAAFKEGTIEVRETVEEPVVAKRARVVEEVVVAKEISERTETVSDAVRNRQVEVERLESDKAKRGSGQATTPATGRYDEFDSDYRTHWQTNYGTAGGRYEDYQPAYRYGSSLAQDQRYRGRNWSDIEADARRDWETRYPANAWDRFKMAVRHGWERVTGNR